MHFDCIVDLMKLAKAETITNNTLKRLMQKCKLFQQSSRIYNYGNPALIHSRKSSRRFPDPWVAYLCAEGFVGRLSGSEIFFKGKLSTYRTTSRGESIKMKSLICIWGSTVEAPLPLLGYGNAACGARETVAQTTAWAKIIYGPSRQGATKTLALTCTSQL